MIRAGDKRMGAVPRQAAKGRLEAEHPAQRGGHANRSVGVASRGKMRQSGGDGGGRSAGGAASGALRIVRIARGAVMAVLGGEAVGVSIHVQHAAEQRASVAQLLHRRASCAAGALSLNRLAPASVGWPATSNRFLPHKARRRAAAAADLRAAADRGDPPAGAYDRRRSWSVR